MQPAGLDAEVRVLQGSPLLPALRRELLGPRPRFHHTLLVS